jgi:DNA-binding transcriptional LysR family regulator
MQPDLSAITVFSTVAETRSFRAAAARLGITASAVSQSIRRLEGELGIALFHRTTRSVTLTEAGDRLWHGVGPALVDITSAIAATTDLRAGPRGRLRLAVSSIAERFLSGPLLADFAAAHPEVQIDVTVTDAEFDIVAAGYDAGVRLGEVIEADMIAVPVTGEQRQIAVAAPSYLARAGAPAHPRDLIHHRCIGWRPAPDVMPYRWEFAEAGRDFDVVVNPEITTNDMLLMIRLASAGAGITFGMAETFRPWIERGELQPLLEDFCSPFPGFFLYFPGRRNMAPKLRALVDFLQDRRSLLRRGASTGT